VSENYGGTEYSRNSGEIQKENAANMVHKPDVMTMGPIKIPK
jgi:hypothetical protein